MIVDVMNDDNDDDDDDDDVYVHILRGFEN